MELNEIEVCVLLNVAMFTVVALAVSVTIQTLLCVRYARSLSAASTPDQAKQLLGSQPPKICVVMPLRGADPFLHNAIRSVVENDYPNLVLQVVIDHEGDSARPIVEAALRDVSLDRYRVEFLRERSPDCSLVCGSIMQGVNSRLNDCDLFSFCAADMIVPSDFYWQMAATMADDSVGCTLGNRWYQPRDGQWGSLLRQAWNAGAAVLMWLFEIPWSGAASLRPADILQSQIRDDWQRSLVEDVTIFGAMQRLGKSLRFTPALTVMNHEEISLRGGFHFMQRQMLWARLYHPRWWLVLGHSLLGATAILFPLALLVVALCQGNWTAAWWSAAGLASYVVALFVLWVQLENTIQRQLRMRGEPSDLGRTWGRLLRMVVTIVITQVLYPLAAIACALSRHVDWRGIRYNFVGGGRVRMVAYQPFAATEQPHDGKTSI